MANVLVLILAFVAAVSSVPLSPRKVVKNIKHVHTVPTYFRRQGSDGQLMSRQSPQYGEEISHPIVEEISKYDKKKAVLKAKPLIVKNGDEVTVSWYGVSKANAKDWIALVCPHKEKIERQLDHFFVDETDTWEQGFGSHKVHVFNMRNDCQFRYFRNRKGSTLVARSNKIGFELGGDAPLQGRLAVTGKSTEMRVMWTAAKCRFQV